MHFCPSSHHFRDIHISNCDLQKVNQMHGIQFSQYFHSMANIKIYKNHPMHFTLFLTVSEILTFHIFYLQKVDHGNRVVLKMFSFDSTYKNIQKSSGVFLCYI